MDQAQVAMQDILLFATLISPLILGLTELVKKTVKFPNNYVPAVAVVLGLIVGFTSGTFSDLELDVRLWAGVLAALSATGIFEFVSKTNGYTK